MTLPLTTFTEIGFTVAFGVLLDTIIVRSVLVTALNLELGERLWWPNRLWRGVERVPATPTEEGRPASEHLPASSGVGRR